MIELIWPWALLAAPLPLLVRWLAAPRERVPDALTVPDLVRFRGADATVVQPGRARSRIRLALLWLAWLALVAAVARPQWVGDPVSLPVTGRDLMLAVDLSGSMGTEDMRLGDRTVNRLEVVKDVVGRFIARRAGDRVGLILFGSNAYLQAPLTFDLATVNRLLLEAPMGIAGGRTAIGDAIGLGVKHLRERPAEQRVLILLTDGASNAGELTPQDAADLARASGVRVHTIGVGADAMPLPGLFGALSGAMMNPSSDMDEPTLTAIAERTGGRYFRARATDELNDIYALIDRLEPVAQDPEVYRPKVALYYWPFAAAWLAIGLLVALRTQRPATG
jgi:Ca-activated chloride channel family protein